MVAKMIAKISVCIKETITRLLKHFLIKKSFVLNILFLLLLFLNVLVKEW